MLAGSCGIMGRMAKAGRRLGMVGSTSTVAIDITDIEYYGKVMSAVRKSQNPRTAPLDLSRIWRCTRRVATIAYRWIPDLSKERRM